MRMRSAYVYIRSYAHGRKSMAAMEDDTDESASLNEAGEPELVSKNGATSVVWKWFGFRPSDTHQSRIFCRTCKRAVLAKGGNTTNLFHHLKQKHFLEYKKAVKAREELSASTSEVVRPKKMTQQTIDVALNSCTPYDKSNKRWGELTNAVTHCLARDMMPVQSVEREGFKKMLKTFEPRYKLPTKKYFSKVALPALYEEIRTEVSNALSSVEFFASTTDMWSSRTSDPYMSLTIHYVDKDWKLQNKCLETSFFPEDHTGENIARVLKEFVSSWNLQEEKQVCVTTDNGANIVKAVALNNWTRLSCFGHRLHIAIERSVKDPRIERAVGVGKKIVAAFGHSWKRQRALQAAQKELGLPEHKLITECCTRWGSKQRMIQRLLEQEKAITQVLAADKTTRHLMLTWQDIEVLDSVSTALSPLLEFTDAFSAEEYVTISCVKPVLQMFNNDMLKVKEGDTELTKDIKTAILDYMNKSYKDSVTEGLVNMASFLDPRFHTEYFSESESEAIKVQVMSELEHLVPHQGSTATCFSETPHTSTGDQTSQGAVKKQKKSLGSFLKGPVSGKIEVTGERLSSELSSYVNSPPADSECDPLSWWKVHTVNFPHISRLARKYLCIPATSSASERLFSTGGNVVTCQRSSLKPASVNMLVFLTKNLKT
ncbi:zinc finger BED domain-containing protein 1-like [Oreochromis niloticus]|uniref:zinc finger BED domain-containing protein 1-like n=1 Tax=Oreochromis niloticus TaxID=8128 RepID=UPI000905461A|nr:zinc finger BED domain-containing protein 1-like [Oreochromis niloticus]